MIRGGFDVDPVIQSAVWKDGTIAVSAIHFGQAAARLAVSGLQL